MHDRHDRTGHRPAGRCGAPVERHGAAVGRRPAQSGQVLILVAVGMSAVLGIGLIAVDLGLLRVTHGQLESAAGAAAMAGAAGLRTTGEDGALTLATRVAAANEALADRMRPIALLPDDFLVDGSTVRVTLRRSPAAGGGVRTWFAPALGLARERTVNATAEAEVVDLCSADAFRPIALLDLWDDLDGDGVCDDDEPYDTNVTGYRPGRDEGLLLRLETFEPRDDDPPTAGSFVRIRLPTVDSGHPPRPGVGNYRRYLEEGAPYDVAVNDWVELQMIPVHSTTYDVLSDLIARDPDAYWSAPDGMVLGSRERQSPRVLKAVLIDPHTMPEVPCDPSQHREVVRITRLAALFIEDVDHDGTVMARLVPFSGHGDVCAAGVTSFGYRARLRARLELGATWRWR